MLTLDSLRARAAILQQLNLGLAEEVARWKGAASSLLNAERQAYLSGIQDGSAQCFSRVSIKQPVTQTRD